MIETAIAITLVVGVTEVIKRAFKLSTRLAPLVSLLLGIGIMFIAGDMGVRDTIVTGIIVGLSASGLYSGTKATKG